MQNHATVTDKQSPVHRCSPCPSSSAPWAVGGHAGSESAEQVVAQRPRKSGAGGGEPGEPPGDEGQHGDRRAEQPEDEGEEHVPDVAGRGLAQAQLVRDDDGAE